MSTAQSLSELLADANELTIVCHNNPDPDCLASALALGHIAEAAGIEERHILYGGAITHQENRAFVNLLEIDLEPFEADAVCGRTNDSLLAFVDHSLPGVNNDVPDTTPVDVVIDHHSVDEEIDARFVDHREGVGATATILTEYLADLDIEPDERLATALLFAIRRETLEFLRGTTAAEYDAAGRLHPHADPSLLRELSSPAISAATVDAIAEAIEHRRVHGSVLITNVGRSGERDALPQAADYLVRLDGVQTAIVFGVVEDAIEVSARSTDSRVHIGDALRDAFADVGTAGGHQEMAGGSIPMGIFADYTVGDHHFFEIVEQVITSRLVAALRIADGDEPRASRSVAE